jgi:hypothetical protein
VRLKLLTQQAPTPYRRAADPTSVPRPLFQDHADEKLHAMIPAGVMDSAAFGNEPDDPGSISLLPPGQAEARWIGPDGAMPIVIAAEARSEVRSEGPLDTKIATGMYKRREAWQMRH